MGFRVVLHPLSTSNHNPWYGIKRRARLYCILFLHQTTTVCGVASVCIGCIASSFYIKPQQISGSGCCLNVVLHPLSTSNHNDSARPDNMKLLYCILFLHQTTTSLRTYCMPSSCIASSFYIKPQPEDRNRQFRRCCIASSFYIKPQLFGKR